MPRNIREPTYDVMKMVILNWKIINHLDPCMNMRKASTLLSKHCKKDVQDITSKDQNKNQTLEISSY